MPGRFLCRRSRANSGALWADQTVTSWPLLVSIRASAVPQVPAPMIPMIAIPHPVLCTSFSWIIMRRAAFVKNS